MLADIVMHRCAAKDQPCHEGIRPNKGLSLLILTRNVNSCGTWEDVTCAVFTLGFEVYMRLGKRYAPSRSVVGSSSFMSDGTRLACWNQEIFMNHFFLNLEFLYDQKQNGLLRSEQRLSAL